MIIFVVEISTMEKNNDSNSESDGDSDSDGGNYDETNTRMESIVRVILKVNYLLIRFNKWCTP